MGGTEKKGKKRKDRNSSGNNSDKGNQCTKQCKQRGPSGDQINYIGGLLSQANAVLYGDSGELDGRLDSHGDPSVFVADCDGPHSEGDMASGGGTDPSRKDLMDYMKSMNDRLITMEKKLSTIDVLEKKVTQFEKDLNKVWLALDDRAKRTDERVGRLEDKIETADMGVSLLSTRVAELEKERDSLRDDITYMKSQSMRNNLVFTGVPEDNTNGGERAEVTERKLRDHLHSALKVAKETAESIRFERVHRMPGHPVPGKVRNIVAKFTFFPDRELVRKEWRHLKGTNYGVHEQYPREVSDKRRRLVKKMKEARDQGKRAWLVYDTLYVDGKPVRD